MRKYLRQKAILHVIVIQVIKFDSVRLRFAFKTIYRTLKDLLC